MRPFMYYQMKKGSSNSLQIAMTCDKKVVFGDDFFSLFFFCILYYNSGEWNANRGRRDLS
jgi:hypothetical protein